MTGKLTGLEEILSPAEAVIIRGPVNAISAWQENLENDYSPMRMVFAIPENEPGLPGALASYRCEQNETLPYVCQGQACLQPVSNIENLKTLPRDPESNYDRRQSPGNELN